MHGLIFETSIWLLAGSTRYACCNFAAEYFDFTETRPQTRVTPKSCFGSEFNMFAVHFFNNSSWTWTPQEHLHRYLLTHSTLQQALYYWMAVLVNQFKDWSTNPLYQYRAFLGGGRSSGLLFLFVVCFFGAFCRFFVQILFAKLVLLTKN